MEHWKLALIWIYERIPATRYAVCETSSAWDTADAKRCLREDAIAGASEGFRAALEAMRAGAWPPLSASKRFYLKEACRQAAFYHGVPLPAHSRRDATHCPLDLSQEDTAALRQAVVEEWRAIHLPLWVEENFFQEPDR